MRYVAAVIAVLAIAFAPCGWTQLPHPVLDQSLGSIVLWRTHTPWPKPESVVDGLRSADAQTRLAALGEMGVAGRSAYVVERSDKPPYPVIGKQVVAPDEVRLIYAALGDSAQQQAIVAMYWLQIVHAAVAIPTATGWQRIALLDCWCKYDLSPDALSNFVKIEAAPAVGADIPEHFELVVHGSGGGSGVYTQTEAHFRVHRGELDKVLSFTSRHYSQDPTSPRPEEMLLRSWFYVSPVENSPGGVLVQAKGDFIGDNPPPAFFQVRNLEIRDLQHFHCTEFKWDEQAFRYEKVSGAPDPCVAQGK